MDDDFSFAIHRNNRIYFSEFLPVGYKETGILIGLLDDIDSHDDKLAFRFVRDENETGSEFVTKHLADEPNYNAEEAAALKLIEAYNENYDKHEPMRMRP